MPRPQLRPEETRLSTKDFAMCNLRRWLASTSEFLNPMEKALFTTDQSARFGGEVAVTLDTVASDAGHTVIENRTQKAVQKDSSRRNVKIVASIEGTPQRILRRFLTC